MEIDDCALAKAAQAARAATSLRIVIEKMRVILEGMDEVGGYDEELAQQRQQGKSAEFLERR